MRDFTIDTTLKNVENFKEKYIKNLTKTKKVKHKGIRFSVGFFPK